MLPFLQCLIGVFSVCALVWAPKVWDSYAHKRFAERTGMGTAFLGASGSVAPEQSDLEPGV